MLTRLLGVVFGLFNWDDVRHDVDDLLLGS